MVSKKIYFSVSELNTGLPKAKDAYILDVRSGISALSEQWIDYKYTYPRQVIFSNNTGAVVGVTFLNSGESSLFSTWDYNKFAPIVIPNNTFVSAADLVLPTKVARVVCRTYSGVATAALDVTFTNYV